MEQDFTLDDLRRQLDLLVRLETRDFIALFPGLSDTMNEEDPELELGRIRRMVDAMSDEERINPDIIDDERRSPIAASSGAEPRDVASFLAQFRQVQAL